MRTKLVFVIDSCFPYYSGGRETWLYEQCKRLMDKYDIEIIAMRRWIGHEKLIHPIPGKVKIYDIPTLYNLPIGGRFHYTKYLFGGVFLFSFLASLLLILKFSFKKRKVVFISLNQGQTFIPSLFVMGSSIYRICTVRGPYVEEMSETFLPFKSIFELFEKASFKHADLIIANGFDTKRSILPLVNNPEKIKVSPNGVDFKRFSRQTERREERKYKKIVSICSLSIRRGTPFLVESILHIREVYKKDFKVYFIGAGNPSQYLSMAKELGVEKFVEFMGEHTDIPEILEDSDIAVALTNGLGISHSLLEEMASGKAIVAWDTYTYTQLLKHEYSGYLVKAWDPKALGDGIACLLENDSLVKTIGENAQKEAEKFDWEILSELFSEFLCELINTKEKIIEVKYHASKKIGKR